VATTEPKARRAGELPQGFSIMAKPTGPACNLNCEYCFYLEKEALFPEGEKYRMPRDVLEAFIRKNIERQDSPVIPFAWQGGEPTLLGVDFFREAVRFEKKYAAGKDVRNSLQTNGTLLTDEWCEFLAKHEFLVGLSLDGPEDVHNNYRVDRGGEPTFDRVMRGLHLLQKHGVEYNILACVARAHQKRGLEIYRFFKEAGAEFIQFIPIVERVPGTESRRLGLELGLPPALDGNEVDPAVTPWTVDRDAYGEFLVEIFDEWVRHDVGTMFVMLFEWTLANWAGLAPGSCFFEKQCGRSTIIEHNGDVYSCDHFMYPEYRLGNVLGDDPKALIDSERQATFGAAKEAALPDYCRSCDVLFACNGECPKHRFTTTPTGEPGLNYLCPSYKNYYHHVAKYMNVMLQLLNQGLPVSNVMKATEGPLVIPYGE
jgi:uncharacterized protein